MSFTDWLVTNITGGTEPPVDGGGGTEPPVDGTEVVVAALPLPMTAVVVAVAAASAPPVAALQAPRFRARRRTCRQTVETRR